MRARPTRARLEADEVGVELDGALLLPATSLTCSSGERVAVLGPNGAGKTTLLRVLSGRLRATRGTATIDDLRLDERDPRVRDAVASLIDVPTLYPDMTIGEHLDLIGTAWGGRRHGAAGVSDGGLGGEGLGRETLDILGIDALQNRFPDELSSGQAQLVALAITLARPASFYLIDEPEQRLDPDRRARVAALLELVSDRGAGVVFSSHSTALVDRLAHRTVRVGG